MDHRNIVKYYEYTENAEYTKKDGQKTPVAYIAMEPILGGELFEYVDICGPFDERMCRYFFKQLIIGLHYLHSNGVCHRDLKPQNILIGSDHILKIVDFGFATPIQGKEGHGFGMTKVGTYSYMAPELVSGMPYQSSVVDLFAAGVILFNIMTAQRPFTVASDRDEWYRHLC